MKKIISILLALTLVFALAACGSSASAPASTAAPAAEEASAPAAEEAVSFKVGICNYVDDASLNQIVENIKNQLAALGTERACALRSWRTTATPTPTSWPRSSPTSSPRMWT